MAPCRHAAVRGSESSRQAAGSQTPPGVLHQRHIVHLQVPHVPGAEGNIFLNEPSQRLRVPVPGVAAAQPALLSAVRPAQQPTQPPQRALTRATPQTTPRRGGRSAAAPAAARPQRPPRPPPPAPARPTAGRAPPQWGSWWRRRGGCRTRWPWAPPARSGAAPAPRPRRQTASLRRARVSEQRGEWNPHLQGHPEALCTIFKLVFSAGPTMVAALQALGLWVDAPLCRQKNGTKNNTVDSFQVRLGWARRLAAPAPPAIAPAPDSGAARWGQRSRKQRQAPPASRHTARS